MQQLTLRHLDGMSVSDVQNPHLVVGKVVSADHHDPPDADLPGILQRTFQIAPDDVAGHRIPLFPEEPGYLQGITPLILAVEDEKIPPGALFQVRPPFEQRQERQEIEGCVGTA